MLLQKGIMPVTYEDFKNSALRIICKIPSQNLFSSYLAQIKSPSRRGQHLPPKHHDKHSRSSAVQNL